MRKFASAACVIMITLAMAGCAIPPVEVLEEDVYSEVADYAPEHYESAHETEPDPEPAQDPRNAYINGTGFLLDILDVFGEKYISLNCLAYALADTNLSFGITADNGVIVIHPGAAHNPTPHFAAMAAPAPISHITPITLKLNETQVDLPSVYISSGYHVSLHDIGRVMDFSLTFADEDNVVIVDTHAPNPHGPIDTSTRVTTLFDAYGNTIDTWILSLDGRQQLTPLNATFRAGRMHISARSFAFALGLPTPATDTYYPLQTLTEAYALFPYFHRANGTIELFSGHMRPERLPVSGSRDAFMRLEDVMARGVTYHCHSHLRRRAIADLLYTHNAAFTLAWIPVNVRPREDFRNDTRDYSRYNLEFVFTMDYMISRGAQMGLHGYTHQRGNQNSVVGSEFGEGISDEHARHLFESQVAAAEHFGWTPYSFTFPKHVGTHSQFRMAGEYFDFIMPNFNMRGSNAPNRIHILDRYVVYMNATEDHLVDQGETHLTALLRRLDRAGDIASFFFHTWLDYAYITITRDDSGRPVVTYDTNSPMHRILANLRDNERVLRPTVHFFGG